MTAYDCMMNAATLATLARRVVQLEKALADYRAALARFTAAPTKYNRHVVTHWARSVRVWRDMVNKTRAELVQA